MHSVYRYAFAVATLFICSSIFAQDAFVQIKDNSQISGQVIEISQIKAVTSFGAVDIPLEKLAGIKLHTTADGTAIFAFKNGDVLTGKPELDFLHLKTTWGKAHINAANIDTIRMNKNSVFVQDGEKGWRITSSQPAATNRRQAP